jgi:hypothetical protein
MNDGDLNEDGCELQRTTAALKPSILGFANELL